MFKNYKQRLIFLAISVIIMVFLFFWNANRSSEKYLPPTPTPITQESSISSTAAHQTVEQTETQSPDVLETKETPTAEAQVNLEETSLVEAQTATAISIALSTIEANLGRKTQQALFLGNKIQTLYSQDVISTTEGKYYHLLDFEQNFSKQGWFKWWFTELQAQNFLLRTVIHWDSATMEDVSWEASGCGIAFGFIDVNNHYRVFLNLDGIVRLHRMIDGEFTLLEAAYYGKLRHPDGHAQLIVVTENNWITIYVNNIQVMRVYEQNTLNGFIGQTVSSGTNYGFGTLCQMLDTELWIFP
ncbi:MAG: hypothetical protein MUO76_08935 [Anaerolineaceae bacterium]|nr:hypothetical protein [Anaerolineaceae bacterium]